MTLRAILRILLLCVIRIGRSVVIGLVTRPTVCRRARVAICMTLRTLCLHMRARQREICIIVIEICFIPIRRVVA